MISLCIYLFFASLGLYTTKILPANEPLGIYRGKVRRVLPQTADEEYVWAVSDTNQKT